MARCAFKPWQSRSPCSLTTHNRFAGWSILLLTAVAATSCGQDQRAEVHKPEDVHALMASMAGSQTSPTGWKDAKAGSFEPLSGGLTGGQVSMLTRSGASAGYVVLAGPDGRAGVVMLSGSAFPKEFVATLSLPAGYLSPGIPRKLSLPPRPAVMIAPFDEPLRNKTATTRVTAGPMSCCLASVLTALQASSPSVPYLFGGRISIDDYWARTRPLLTNQQAVSAYASKMITQDGRFVPDMPSIERNQQRERAQEQALRHADLSEEREVKTKSGFPIKVRTSKDGAQAFYVVSPIIRQAIGNRTTPYERLQGLNDEQLNAEGLPISASSGMRTAFLLEHGYLKGSESLDAALEEFGRTRGFFVTVTRKPVSQVTDDELPCLLEGPRNIAAVLLALSNDRPGWGLIAIPETVVETRRTFSEAPIPSVQTPSSQPVASDSKTLSRDRMREMIRTSVMVSDPSAQPPGSLDSGAHLVVLGCLDAKWKAVPLNKWRPLDNWDLVSAKPDPEPPSIPEERREGSRRSRPGMPVPPLIPERDRDRSLSQAQLRVLSVMVDESRSRQAEQVKDMVDDYVAQGMSREAFAPAELKRAALQWTVDQVVRSHSSRAVTQARRQYHINPDELYPLLPSRKVDAVLQFRDYARTHDSSTLRKIHSEPLDRESIKGIIGLAEDMGPQAVPDAVAVLWNDWSKEGRDYLYAKLQAATGPDLAQKILRTLGQREQVDAAALGRYVESTTDEKLLSAAFHVADASLYTDPQARQFLENELKTGGKRQRELAVKSLGGRFLPEKDFDKVLSMIRGEPDPAKRAGLIANLGRSAGDPNALTLLHELIAHDPSPQVRVAAVQAIPERVIVDEQMKFPADDVELITVDDLRQLTAGGSKELRDAVEAKIAAAAAEKAEREQRFSRMRGPTRPRTRPAR